MVRFPRNTEPKVARSEEPFPVRSAAAKDVRLMAPVTTLNPTSDLAPNAPSPLPAKIDTLASGVMDEVLAAAVTATSGLPSPLKSPTASADALKFESTGRVVGAL